MKQSARGSAGHYTERYAMTIQQILVTYPNIGTLTRKGRTIYYVNWPVYREAYHPIELV